jgi:hypothetical protein
VVARLLKTRYKQAIRDCATGRHVWHVTYHQMAAALTNPEVVAFGMKPLEIGATIDDAWRH